MGKSRLRIIGQLSVTSSAFAAPRAALRAGDSTAYAPSKKFVGLWNMSRHGNHAGEKSANHRLKPVCGARGGSHNERDAR